MSNLAPLRCEDCETEMEFLDLYIDKEGEEYEIWECPICGWQEFVVTNGQQIGDEIMIDWRFIY